MIVVHALDQGLVVYAVFPNLRNSFDSLDHVILLKRLQLVVYGVELKWFQNYLSDHDRFQ